jgi:uncharacterized C2H2 Zn-finger protein
MGLFVEFASAQEKSIERSQKRAEHRFLAVSVRDRTQAQRTAYFRCPRENSLLRDERPTVKIPRATHQKRRLVVGQSLSR